MCDKTPQSRDWDFPVPVGLSRMATTFPPPPPSLFSIRTCSGCSCSRCCTSDNADDDDDDDTAPQHATRIEAANCC